MNDLVTRAQLWAVDRVLRGNLVQGPVPTDGASDEQAFEKLQNDKVGRLLLNQFAGVLVDAGAAINRVERLLRSLRVPAYLMAHAVVAKCLLLMDRHPKARLQEMFDSGQLERELGGRFNSLLSSVGFENSRRTSNIRELYAEEIFKGIGEISLPLNVSNEASHHENHMDMMFVVAAAKLRQSKRIFEFGTYMGRTTCGFASIAPDVEVFTLNLPPSADPRYGPYIGKLIKTSPYRGRVREIHCDSRQFETSTYAKSMDYIFIDADHSYDAVKNDTEKAFEMLSPGGMIVWHDYAPKSPGVYGYLYELSLERPLFRIKNTCLALYIDGVDTRDFIPEEIGEMLEDA